MSTSERRGIRAYYEITDTLKNQLLLDPNVKTVTSGDITRINLEKAEIFPLSHVTLNSMTQSDNAGSGTLTFDVTIFSMDIISNDRKTDTVDLYIGNTNEQDIINTQLSVSNLIVQRMRGGDLFKDEFQVLGDVSYEFFTERFSNELAGVAASFSITTYNDIWFCK